MNESSMPGKVVAVDTTVPVWEQFFTVAPLVLVGTRDADGSLDLAPKHMVTPMGWQNYFGFVCTPRHNTCSNIERTGEFTVSYPKPSQVLVASLAASPRDMDSNKPVLDYFRTFPAREVDGEFIEDGYLFFECLPTLGLSLAVFSFALLMQNMFKLADLVLAKGVPALEVGRLLLLTLPALMPLLLPVSLLLAVLLAMGRLSADSEIMVSAIRRATSTTTRT